MNKSKNRKGPVVRVESNRQSIKNEQLLIAGAIIYPVLAMLSLVGRDSMNISIAIVLLMVAGVAGLVARGLLDGKSSKVDSTLLAVYITYPLLGLAFAMYLGIDWVTASLLIVAGVLFGGSYLERQAWLVLLGNVFLVLALFIILSQINFLSQELFYGLTWISAGTNYLAYWCARRWGSREYSLFFLIAVLTALLVGCFYGFTRGYIHDSHTVGLMLATTTVVIGLHIYLKKRRKGE